MSNSIGTTANPLRVAVFGSGPAGFYASEELLKQTQPIVSVDLFDRLPTPFGLVRGGVAPDHQKIKTVTRLFERTAGRPRFRFFGNVNFGQDIHLEEVLEQYHQVLFCTGAESDRQMGIPGEALAGSYPATAFVGWYNGHPDYRNLKFELGVESVAVVGIGNVAMDVARILTRPVEDLARTDIAAHALEALRASKVRTVYLLGRRGPAQAAFTNPEIRELGEIPGTDLVIRPEDMALDELSREFLSQQKDPVYQRNVEILTTQAEKGPGVQAKKIHLWFFTSPAEVLGASRVERLRLEKNTLVRDAKGRVQA
ncbi:MAG: FAD-dependent oxidoreductase, partial [Deltaproteobacteria bacterium]|nr:FAD-dependent oxidoreductase [Deltaproteobacteria bacterium]